MLRVNNTIISFAFVVITALFFRGNVMAQNPQDCIGAITVCQDSYTQYNTYSGVGAINDIPSDYSCPITCMGGGEKNSVWYTFQVQQSGWLDFRIQPHINEDYDWALFNLTTHDCSALQNPTLLQQLEVSCNWTAQTGITGANSLSPNSGSHCVGSSGAPNNPRIWVNVGEIYYLNVSNYTGGSGYNLDFRNSTAKIFDNTPPSFVGINTNVSCGSNTLTVYFSENVMCSSVNPGDFYIVSESGVVHTVTSIYSTQCSQGGGMDNQFTLTVTPAITEGGTYSISLVGPIQDMCGNVTNNASFSFFINYGYPVFNSLGPYCQGDTPDALPSTSVNGISGTWSPSVINTNTSGTMEYFFTPNAGQCANPTSISVYVAPDIEPIFGNFGPYCVGDVPLNLPGTSNNGISGVWSPSIINTSTSGTHSYTFTPTGGGCASEKTISVTVNPAVTPTFGSFGPYCEGDTPASLPGTSNNGISGTWSPSTINTGSSGTTSYTFTPNAGQCASPTTISVTVNPAVTPTFGSFGPYCEGDTPASLPGTSNNGISGTWSPSTINTGSSGTTSYTFTPNAGQCASPTTISVTVSPAITPTFGSFGPYCEGDTPASLPGTSNNGISGTWSPSTINTGSSGTTSYTFTPNAGQCASPTTISVTVNPAVTPTFGSFGPYCEGDTPASLPGTSNNGISGTWSPSTINTGSSGTTSYTFTPNAGQCASPTTISVTVNPAVTPTFGSFGPYCEGDTPASLPGTSNNGISGTWSPSTINTGSSGTTSYTFTPNAGQCASPTTISVTVNPAVTPTFGSFGPYCEGDTPASLPGTSNNGISGTWSPSTINTGSSGTTSYTFTPNAGQCASPTTISVTVSPVVTPTFGSFGPYCEGDTPASLPGTSNNGISGTWSPSTINTGSSGTTSYTFTPNAGQCASITTISVTISPPPIVSITNNSGSNELTCDLTDINVTATGGGTYTWSGGSSLTTANNSFDTPGTYTVTVTADNGCTATESIAITENIVPPIVVITNNSGTNELTCDLTDISVTATGGGTYTWSGGSTQTTANNTFDTPGTYTVTVTSDNGCTATESIAITENIAPPIVGITNNSGSNELTCDLTDINVTATGGGTYTWSGGSSLTTANNSFDTPGTYTVTVTADNGCTATESIAITENIVPPIVGITNNSGSNELTCDLTDINVTATGGGTYTWSGGSSLTTANNSFDTPGTYTVTVTADNGCTATESIAITENIVPPIVVITNNSGTNELTCDLTDISVTATGGGTYTWSGGSTQTTANNTFDTPGTYTVTVTADNGCTATESIVITENIAPPIVGITNNSGTNELTCDLTDINVTATGGGTYTWSGGSSLTTANNSFDTPGTYTVTVTADNGCTATESIIITENIAPPIVGISNNSGSNELTCDLTDINVTATGGGTYTWSGGSTQTTANNSFDTPGTYTVTVTADNGCTATESIIITENIAPPIVGITNNSGSNELTCDLTDINVSATGGGTYTWSGGSSLTTANNSFDTPGTYTVTVTADNGCTATESIAITENIVPPIVVITNNSGTNELTCDLTDISVTATGGGTYTWSGGSTQTTANNTFDTPGTYTVTVTADNGCTATESIIITENIAPPIVGITNNSGSNELTCGLTDISVTATGGGTYTWSGGSTQTTANNSFDTPGTYTVTVTADNGCTATESIIITENIAPPIVGITNNSGSNELTCDLTDINVSATGGGTYTWSGGSSLTTANNSFDTPGTYTVTVTADNGCTATESIAITENIVPPIVVITNNSGTNELTCDLTDISVTATGGGTYTWSGGSTQTTANNTFDTPGTYTVTVTSDNGCTATESIAITENIVPPIVVITNNSGTNELTCDLTDISVTATGGGTYTWSGGSTQTTANNTFDTPGTYTVTVTSDNGCTATESIAITENIVPPIVVITNNSGTNELTCDLTDISVTATGGGTYTWSGGSTQTTANNTFDTPGTYTVTVTSDNGCTATESIAITENIVPPIVVITNNSGTNELTCDLTDINVTATGGGTYTWSGGSSLTTANNSFDTPGTYTVTVTADNGCTATESIAITENIVPPIVVITNNSGTNELTCDLTDISVTATGGGTYTWSGGSTQTTANNSFDTPGTYTVTVTADNGCTATESIIITENIAPPIVGITNNSGSNELTCDLTDINVSATGGGTYTWSGGSSLTTANNSFDTPGTYTVTVTADNGCTATESIAITENIVPPIVVITNNSGTNELTCDLTDISVTATGGGTYTWSGGSSLTTANNSFDTPGTYTVTVTADNGCTATESIAITENIVPPIVVITNNSGTNELTCDLTDISVTATGGGTYTWSGGSTQTTANNTFDTPGTYTVTVTADNGCTATESIVITENIAPPIVVITNNSGTNELTCDLTDISVTATGGGTYTWSGGSSLTTANNSFDTPGTYTVTVTADNGCTATESIAITENIVPPIVVITNNSGTNELTCDLTDISVTATGGGTYTWSGGSTQTTANNTFDTPGTYTVTVTADNGCTATESIIITENIAPPIVGITNNSGSNELTCGLTDISVTATGGGTYTWSGGSTQTTANNSFDTPGTYTVTVTADNGCTATESIIITENIAPPIVGITNNSGSNELTCDLTDINVSATGGGTYTWSGGSSLTTANNSFDTPGTYTVTVTADNGCTATESIAITENIVPPIVVITNNSGTNELTCDLTDISVTATGGGTYTWSGGSTQTTANNTFDTPGTYTVTVTSDNGCTATESIAITENIVPPIVVITNNSGTNELTCDLTDISVTATGGGTYTWSGGSTQTTANNTFDTPGTYTVTVTSDNGCTATESIAITENIVPPIVVITNNSGTNELTCDLTDISVTATGGGTYTWSGGSTQTTANNTFDTPGTYTVTVTSDNGCTATESIAITENIVPPIVVITNNSGTNELTCDLTDINVTATGGGTYTWSGGSSLTTANNSFDTPGTYTVTVTADNGCTATESIAITENIVPPIVVITNNSGTNELTCDLTDISVTATGGGTYTWSGGSTQTTANNTFDTPGTYTVTVTADNGCTATESIVITENIAPPIVGITNNSGSNELTCDLTDINVTATGGGTYTWSGGSSLTTANNSFDTPGTYTVTVTADNGCTATESIAITENIVPPIVVITNNSGTNELTCDLTDISVTATGGGTYTWSGGSTQTTANNTFDTPGTYTVTVTADNGCTATESIVITENIAPPIVGITNNSGTNELTCDLTDINVTATGGGTYTWSGGSSLTTANNSFDTPGTYTVTVTADNGCTATESIIITENIAPPIVGISNNSGSNELTCDLTDINVTATGGGTYTWSGGSTQTTANNSFDTPGTYTVTVTADNGCTATESIIITENIAPPIVGITNNSGSNELTCDLTDINVSATGGGTYTWSGGSSLTTANNSFDTPGTYTVTVTADNGCTATESIAITENIVPPIVVITNNSGTNELTCDLTDISVTATGGGTYTWSGGSSLTTANNSFDTPGTYTVTVTADNGCTATESIAITENIVPPIVVITNNSGTNELTCDLTDISVTATGGGTYTWSGGSTQTTANNTFDTPGTYTVTVTADNGCTATESIIITENIAPPIVGITNNSGSNELTCGLTDISVTATGGGTYTWSGGSTQTTANNSFDTPGTYTVTVTADNGCTATESIIITENIAPPIVGITNNSGSNELTCDLTDINVSATGGGTYTWSGGSSLTTANNSFDTPGTYTVTVTADNGCTATESIAITENIVPPIVVITNNSGTNELTCDLTDISVTATGGGTYTWSGGSTQTTANNTFDTPGTYTVTVTSDNGCTATESIAITENIVPPIVVITNNSGTNELTCDLTDISVTATGGGTYTWSGGSTQTTANNTFDTPGTYTVTVTADNGCTATESIIITENIAPPIVGITNNSGTNELTCDLTDINVTATGGGTYTWSGGSSLTTANNSFDTPGTYTVTVTADNGCTATESIVIIQDISVPNASISGNAEICNGESSSITASGGGTYQWNTGETIASISVSPTSTSTYTVTVTSSNACTSTADFTLTVHENPSVDINYSPSCYGESVAVSAEASPTGTYSYNWMVPSGASNPGNNGSFTTNVEGSYYVTITDVNTCSATSSFTLTYPDILDAYFTKNDVSCNGGNDGFIDMTIEGGTPTYSILWSDGDTSEDRMGLTAGTYSVTVTDDIGCTVSLTVPIIEPAALSISETINNVSCNDGDNGSISIVVSGGNAGGYTYLWSNGANSSTINNLAYGIYSVTVTDPKSCTITATYSVTEPELLAISGEITHPKCYGGEDGEIEITISGGTPGYTYTWNGTPFYALLPDLYDIEAGEYVIVVTDANMCTATQTYTLIEPAEIMPEFVVTHQTCDNNNGEIMVNVSGGTPDYSYLWDNSAANATVTHIANLNSGQYSITITDANDCTKDTVVEVERIIPPEIVLNNIVNETCSDENASITVEVVNGRADYNYLWSANAEINSPNITNISAGTHYLTVVDADGCMDTAEYVITNHESPLPQIAHISPAHCDQNDGTAQITVSGGTGDYTYEWNTAPPRYGSNETDMYGGVYDVVVSDGVCDVVLEVNIPNLPGPNVVASATPTVINVERANIHFTDHSTAEGEIVDWIWDFDNGQVSYFQDVHYKYELPGNYNVQLTVTDEFGCVGTDSLEIVVMEDLEFWIPNAFTPDRDGLNDMFGPIASGFINDGYEMVIYDRWGKVAFYSNDYYKRWDGSINGRKVETNSVFVYKISIFDLFGKEHKFRGRVSIIYGLE